MARETIIAERPVPPKGRLSFPMLILRMIANPVASWGEDFYEEPAVLYRWFGLQTLYVMDPALIQRILLDDAESYSNSRSTTMYSRGDRRPACSTPRETNGAGSAGSRHPCSGPRRCSAMPAFVSVGAPLLKRWKDPARARGRESTGT
jgi:hypothetical protein